jgi:hypothetical protein
MGFAESEVEFVRVRIIVPYSPKHIATRRREYLIL